MPTGAVDEGTVSTAVRGQGLPTLKTQDQDSTRALVSLYRRGTGGALGSDAAPGAVRRPAATWAHEGTGRAVMREEYAEGRPCAAHTRRPSVWGRGRRYSPYRHPHGPMGSTGGAIWWITRGRMSLLRRLCAVLVSRHKGATRCRGAYLGGGQ